MVLNWSGYVLRCIDNTGYFKAGEKYYCFADEGHTFWMYAPFLVETLGVDQVCISNEKRKYFVAEM